MEAKDVALLGFVSCAKEYINRHINDGVDFGDLNNLDIHKLSQELSAELRNYQGSKEDIRALLKSGGEAFSDYVKEKIEVKNNNIVDALGSVFDFGTGDIVKEEVEDEETVEEETKESKLPAFDSSITDDIANKIIYEEIGPKEVKDPINDYGLSDDDDILKKIALSASKSNEELARRDDDAEDLDKVISDVVENEKQAAKLQEKAPLNARKVEEVKAAEKPNEEEKEIPWFYDPTKIVYIENPGLSAIDRLEGGFKDFFEHDEYIDGDEIDEDEHIAQLAAIANKGDGYGETYDDTYNEAYASYVGDITKEEKEEYEQILDNIRQAYQYLSASFIRNVYEMKNTIDAGLDDGASFVILHRLSFKDIDRLREFVEVMMNHNYLVNVDEDKMIVDTFRELIKEEGVAIIDILTIANQAKVLDGYYEGYRLIRKEA